MIKRHQEFSILDESKLRVLVVGDHISSHLRSDQFLKLNLMSPTEEIHMVLIMDHRGGRICSRYVGANIKNLGKRMTGFGNNIYMPKFYYEAIYRALFHTPLTLDLALIAQKYLLNIVTITFILRYDYGISSESLSYVHDNDDLITIIENFRKNRLTSENNQILQRTKEEIKYQPGSLAYEAGASRFGQPEEGHRNLYQQSIYNTISEFCRTHDDPAPLYNYIRDLELEENILERFLMLVNYLKFHLKDYVPL